MFTVILIIAIIETFLLAVILLLPRRNKYDGKMVVKDAGKKKMFSLELDTALDELPKKKSIRMKVVDETS
jgi:hypothetical protein